MSKATRIIIIVLFLTSTSLGTLIDLTDKGLGLQKGNYGTSLQINDLITLAALTRINGIDSQQGTIYVEKNKGIGVQNSYAGGSKGISGSGDDQDEALVFNFSSGVSTNGFTVGLNEYEQKADNTIINMLFGSGLEMSFDKTNANWTGALTSLSRTNVNVNIGQLVGANFSNQIKRLTVSETQGHIYVNCIGYDGGSITVPEPTTIAMLGFGLMIFALPGRRDNRQK